MVRVGIIKERRGNERRVSLVPADIKKLVSKGIEVLVERGSGEGAYFLDGEYEEAGARILNDAKEVLSNVDILIKVQPPSLEEAKALKEGAIYIGFTRYWENPEYLNVFSERGITAFALEKIPRTTKAQFVDVLSSQATIAGYKAVILAADLSPHLFPMLTTAAGTLKPAKVLVIGVGVAGLQALATAKRLGALTFAYDIRPAAKYDAQSVGAKFLESPVWAEGEGGYARELTEEERRIQHEFLAKHIGNSDVVITTAQVPGKRAPLIITKDMVERMKAGSVIVDIAADNGGNCELTKVGEVVEYNGVKIAGPLNVPSSVPRPASEMFSKNMANFLELIIRDGQIKLDFGEEILEKSLLIKPAVKNE
jgi:NAD(P) transhydrogenase subunit alpha